jgi:site-specific DNA-methyltransferase (adenine-specific)
MMTPNYKLILGDNRQTMKEIPDGSVDCVVTSPPYFNLRDYNNDGQIGLEATPEAYVAELVAVFREVWRVLKDDGTVWLNLGDSYAATSRSSGASMLSTLATKPTAKKTAAQRERGAWKTGMGDTKPKNILGIPWRVAFALQADGWYLRQDIIWHKPNPMPESVTDRCTKAHEYIFLLSKSARYYYDAEAVKEGLQTAPHAPGNKKLDASRNDHDQMDKIWGADGKRNRRSVWTVATQPYSGAHFATFPPKLIEPCILAGCPVGGTVLDPFGGSGTTAAVALAHGRNAILCELNPDYGELIHERVGALLTEVRNAAGEIILTAKERATGQMGLFGGDV